MLIDLIEKHQKVGAVLKSQNPELHEKILRESPLNPEGTNFVHESIFLFAFGLKQRPKCLVCGVVERRFKNIKTGYVKTCQNCKGKSDWRKEQFRISCTKKFGSTTPSGNPSVMDRIYATKVSRGQYKTHHQRTLYTNYSNEVHRLTRLQPIHTLQHFEKRGKSGVPGTYQLDHLFSIYDGFRLGIAPSIIADISNLRMIPSSENRKKWHHSCITLEELLSKISKVD